MLPERIAKLDALAKNLRWSWHQETRDLFRAIDPRLWEEVGEDPVKLLSAVRPERVQQLAADQVFARNVGLLHDDLVNYLSDDLWFQRYAAENEGAPAGIGYFSAEFGVSQVLPQYSGGLGILAGDHLKAASDLGLPLIGVGLLYRFGYFRQWLNASGWQQERYPVLPSNEMPVARLLDSAGNPQEISVEVFGREVYALRRRSSSVSAVSGRCAATVRSPVILGPMSTTVMRAMQGSSVSSAFGSTWPTGATCPPPSN